MGEIIIEFGTPNAREKARTWKEELVEAIEKAILNTERTVLGEARKIFKEDEFSVYFTFKQRKANPK